MPTPFCIRVPVLKYNKIVKGHPSSEKVYNFFQNVITTKLIFILIDSVPSLKKWSI